MGIIAWIIFGALAGWVGSWFVATNGRQGCLTNIAVGIIGAFIGGAIYKFITGEHWNFKFNPSSFVVAVAGAIVLLVILSLARRRPL